MADPIKIPWTREELEAVEKKLHELYASFRNIRLNMIDFGAETVNLTLGTLEYRLKQIQKAVNKNATDAIDQTREQKEKRLAAVVPLVEKVREEKRAKKLK